MTAALRALGDWAEAEARKRPGTPFASRLFRFNWLLLTLGLLLSGLGLLNQYTVALNTPDDFFYGHMLRLALGFLGFLLISLLDIRFIRLAAFAGVLLVFGLLVYVQFFGLTLNQSTRWISLGRFTLQPSEIAQVALIVFLAAYFDARSPAQLGNLLWLLPPALVVGAIAYLIFQQPDLGTTLKLLILVGLITFCAGLRWWLVISVTALTAGLVAAVLTWPDRFLKPYQMDRVTCFLLSDVQIEALGEDSPCDQPRLARVAIGAAGIWGHGVLNAPQLESLIIYEPYNDMILAVHAEQFGLVGTLGLLVLVGSLIYLGFIVALSCRSQFARLMALGASLNFALYATINLLMVLSFLPVVGMPFAFLSQGGTVTLSVWVSLGLINNAWINRHLLFSPADEA